MHLITADRLWDGTGQPLLVRPLMRVSEARVESIERSLLGPPTCSGELRSFPDCTILPGLIDTHVHLVFSALPTNQAIIEQVTRETDEELFQRAASNALAALKAGITTVRDCGGRGNVVQRLRDFIRAGQLPGADILSCGAPITTTLGHCHWLGLIADTPDQVRAAAQRMLEEDADFLKVMATGGNMTPTSDPMKAQYGLESLSLIADMARQASKHAAAHVLSRAALPDVVQANYRTIEHCDWRVEENCYEFLPDLAKQIIDQNQYVGLTCSATMRRAFLPEIRNDLSGPVRRLDMRFACERKMIESGIPFTLHSDAGVRLTPINRFDLGLRAAQIELGLTPSEVLHAVTSVAATAIGLPDRGVLTPGKRADLIVVEGDPVRDLQSLGKIRAVMQAGQWIVL